ncbi:MAG: quinone oxidoreductase family protein [Hyphomicrobiaceae bacterium]
MAHAVQISQTGGPDVLSWVEVAVGPPKSGEVRLRQTAIGLNYIDVYHREGLYPIASLPAAIGMEAAGVIVDVGADVDGLEVGDRVAYADVLGSYAEERCVPAGRVVKLPDSIDDQTAAAMMLQGLTAQYLLRRTFSVGPSTTMLFHAAAGGVGLIACQWARHLGATIIGTVGSEEKAKLAKENGCTHTINYRDEDFVARVKELTDGRGCDVVYDSIGKDTYPASLDCLKPRGLWVSYGNASGAVEAFNIGVLAQKGSLFATRPTLMTYISERQDLEAATQELFDVVEKGHVKISVNQTYALSDVATAHRDLEARQTTGSTVLTTQS